MNGDNAQNPTWEIRFSEPAESDLEGMYLNLSRHLGMDRATEWVDGLREALSSLTIVGPRMYPLDETHTRERGREVRRLLYQGPSARGRRRGGSQAYHVLYAVFPPDEMESMGIVRVLRILPALRGLDFPDATP